MTVCFASIMIQCFTATKKCTQLCITNVMILMTNFSTNLTNTKMILCKTYLTIEPLLRCWGAEVSFTILLIQILLSIQYWISCLNKLLDFWIKRICNKLGFCFTYLLLQLIDFPFPFYIHTYNDFIIRNHSYFVYANNFNNNK